jgi:uncharacterized membrane protein
MRVTSVGHAIFAATLFANGILGLARGDFAPIWQPVPKGMPAREALVYLCIFISLACGTGLLWRRIAAATARALLAYLLLWLLLFKARSILLAPNMEVSYESCGETAVLVAGAAVLYCWFAANRDGQRLGFDVGDCSLHVARGLYGLALIAFGLSHFAYLKQTAALVPGWLLSHAAWAYFTGAAYIAAGAATLTGVYARLAAALSALQMGLFTVLVWLPAIVAGANAFQWDEFVVSCSLTAGAWVVADSYSGMPWLTAHKGHRPSAPGA